MSKVPAISIENIQAYTGQQNHTGPLCNAYSPLKNLEDAESSTLGNFTTEELNFDLLHPVDIILQDSYDGAVNMVLNDGKNVPRLINSRFSVINGKEFKIPEHTGHKNTNIYDEKTFSIDTSLKAIALKIPQIEYRGMTQFAGSLPCGAYTFYFKLADADGNESEVLAESGIVQVYIGETSTPDINIRMGLQDENSGKSVNFKLTNIDSGFDYVHVLYARSSSGDDQAAVDTYHKIMFDYPISNEECDITITGKEKIIGISAEELYTDYADIESVKSQSVVNNVLFFGNIKKQEHDWNALRIASWKITYSCGTEANIGSIDRNYTLLLGKKGEDYGLYYNTYNSYYKIGYWPDEIYRFGIVYIFEDNSLSPVFNLLGVDFLRFGKNELDIKDLLLNFDGTEYYQWETSPEDYYFDKTKGLNSKGVVKFPKATDKEFVSFKSSFGGIITPQPLYIKFNLDNIGTVDLATTNSKNVLADEFFKKHKIKGYFFVRQRRVPTILAQGVAVGLSGKDNGALPVIKIGNSYRTLSFLSLAQMLQPEGSSIEAYNVSVNALYVPDAELSEATFNLLFVSNKYTLESVFKYSFANDVDEGAVRSYVLVIGSNSNDKHKRKLTNVPEDTKILTDGEMYFSTIAGNASEPYKTADAQKIWDKTAPQDLTQSTSLIRGNWGCFVGVGEDSETDGNLTYGSVYNIKQANYFDDEASATELDFKLRMEREDSYQAICDRTEISKNEILCYRGDCYQSLFTHRVMRNFADPELPTNTKIINPACWAQNYAVRCTALADVSAISNLAQENDGWNIPTTSSLKTFANEVAQAFEVSEVNGEFYKDYWWDTETLAWYRGTSRNPDTDEYIGPTIGGTLSVSYYVNNGGLKLVKPSEQESGGIGGIIKNIFKSSRWALRGLSGINRADVNAVGLGQWITFPICSSKNLALRDIDYSNATEQAAFNRKRSFYPLQKMDIHNPLRDSNIINLAAGISLPHKKYYLIPNVPFIKQEYFTRVLNSLRDSASSITNEFKVMLESAYRDYTKIHGPITKLVPLGSKMLVVFHHGIGVLALNDTMSQAENALLYLPVELSMIVSPDYGSMWKDSIIETPKGIYGVDTVAKVIWKVVPSEAPLLQLISNFKVEKFLIDNIDLSEFTTSPFVGRINVKTHYNAFKLDVIFTYYNDILYKFEGVPNKLSDYRITSDGCLLELNKTTNLWELTDYQGEKVKAYYDEDKGQLIDYAKQVDATGESYDRMYKWAKGKSWSLCFNEVIEKFVTFYDWIPIESENIDNIWFSFDREATNKLTDLGYCGGLSKYIAPSGDSANIKERTDYKYGLNAIDPTFNTSAPITYFDDTYKIEFPLTYTYQKDKVTVAGFYLKNGANYTISISRKLTRVSRGRLLPSPRPAPSKYFELCDQEGWTFVPIRFHKPFSDYTYTISIIFDDTVTVNGDGDPILYYDQAVSHMIVLDIANPNWTSENSIEIVSDLPDEELPDYYTVRTLSDALPLWKHGQAGIYDNADEIKPTFWYGQLHEFNFEFIARKDAMHKVYNNLLIISNKAEPHKFEFEVIGEAYDWHKYKPVLKWIADLVKVATDNPLYESKLNAVFIEVLTTKYGDLKRNHSDFPRIFGIKDGEYFEKLPYLKVTDACVPTLDPLIIGEKKGTKDDNIFLPPEWYDTPEGEAHSDNTVDCCLVYDKQLNEFRVHTELLGNDVWKYGRLRGNMQYLEDLWRIEIRPISFKYAYVVDKDPENGLSTTKITETRHRDKHIKIKIRYTGKDLAVIQGISTLFDYSYA